MMVDDHSESGRREDLRRPDVLELLGYVLEVQRDLNRTLAPLVDSVQALLDGAIVGRDAALINALSDAFDQRNFMTAEVVSRSTWDDDAARRLAGQIGPGVGVRNLGIRLGKLVGLHTASGLTLQRVKAAPGPSVWQVFGG